MPFPKEKLNPNEQVVLDLRPHWWYFVRQTAVLVLTIIIGVLTLALAWPTPLKIAAAVLIVAALVWFLARYVVWWSTNFVITTDRLIDRQGVFHRTGIEIPLERVNTVHFSQNLGERVLGFGDLIIESAGEQGALVVDNIRKPLNVQNEIYQQMEANENRKYDRIGRSHAAGAAPATPAAAPSSTPASASGHESIPDQIEKLAELHRDGVLTDREFDEKKKELLDRL